MNTDTQRVVVFGATSAIASALCRRLAEGHAYLHLIGRDTDSLRSLAADLELRGARRVSVAVADLDDTTRHADLVEQAWSQLENPGCVLLAYGALGDQAEAETVWERQFALIQTNLVSQLSLLTLLANRFEAQGSGCLAAISSVAGDRGRASNYIYASTKAGLSCYLQGLQQRLLSVGVRVVDLRPGWVDTPMTAEFRKGPLWSSPERIAVGMHRALLSRSGTIYLPAYWRAIMAVVRVMPSALLRRLGL